MQVIVVRRHRWTLTLGRKGLACYTGSLLHCCEAARCERKSDPPKAIFALSLLLFTILLVLQLPSLLEPVLVLQHLKRHAM